MLSLKSPTPLIEKPPSPKEFAQCDKLQESNLNLFMQELSDLKVLVEKHEKRIILLEEKLDLKLSENGISYNSNAINYKL